MRDRIKFCVAGDERLRQTEKSVCVSHGMEDKTVPANYKNQSVGQLQMLIIGTDKKLWEK